MLYKLALRMGRTVGELSAVMPVDEFVHWMAIDRQSPIGDERFDYLFAQINATACSVSGAKRRGGGQFKLTEFLLFKQPEIPQDAKALMAGMFGGRIVKGKSKRTK